MKELLKHLNVVDWGYTEELRPQSFDKLDAWVKRGDHGILNYLSDHRKEARSNLKNVFPEAKSALCFLFSYHPEKLALENFYQGKESNGHKMASYVLGFEGKDYHLVVRDNLEQIAVKLQEKEGPFHWRHSLDIQPVLERDLAYRCGLGWFGKNSMLINRKHGSFFIIGSLLLDQTFSFEKKNLEVDHCGQCRACVEACPTDAIDENNRTLVANKCISTWTIEVFKEGPEAPKGMGKANGEIFGCDICQDVCPWNHRPVREGLEAQEAEVFHNNSALLINDFLRKNNSLIEEELNQSSSRGFQKKYKQTPLERTGKRGLLKNFQFWKKP